MELQPDNLVPAWLETPPLTSVKPPVVTRAQELPFDELAWEAFEKLCLRLAKLESSIQHCQLYGTRGQGQKGIDLYARQKHTGVYSVYQCKREKNFGPGKIEDAVDKFLAGLKLKDLPEIVDDFFGRE